VTQLELLHAVAAWSRSLEERTRCLVSTFCTTVETLNYSYILTLSVCHSFNRQVWTGLNPFYPRDAMLARVFATATCLSVCLSVRHAPVLYQNEES